MNDFCRRPSTKVSPEFPPPPKGDCNEDVVTILTNCFTDGNKIFLLLNQTDFILL